MIVENLLGAIPIPVVVIERAEKIFHINNAGERLLGHGLTGRHYVVALRQPILLDAVESTMKDTKTRNAQYLGNVANRDVEYNVCCTFSKPDHVVLFFEDQSGLREITEMRRDFIANVSHELKTPLTSLLGFIETLQSTAKNDKKAQTHFLAIMENEAKRMDRMVGDLLSLSRVEATERIRPTDIVEVNTIVRQSALALEPMINSADIVLNIDVPEYPVFAVGDKDQLGQVLINLIENAVKYGNYGGTVDLRLRGVRYEAKLRSEAVSVSVEDFGPGIDPFYIPRITERFFRIDNHRSRELGGTGLGLAIVKHIINRHRGRLLIESQIGIGTKFKILLPAD